MLIIDHGGDGIAFPQGPYGVSWYDGGMEKEQNFSNENVEVERSPELDQYELSFSERSILSVVLDKAEAEIKNDDDPRYTLMRAEREYKKYQALCGLLSTLSDELTTYDDQVMLALIRDLRAAYGLRSSI